MQIGERPHVPLERLTEDAIISICKTEFRVAGTRESPTSSGNRCIIAVHKERHAVHVLLVYHKNDIGSGNETATWKNIVHKNYPEYRQLL